MNKFSMVAASLLMLASACGSDDGGATDDGGVMGALDGGGDSGSMRSASGDAGSDPDGATGEGGTGGDSGGSGGEFGDTGGDGGDTAGDAGGTGGDGGSSTGDTGGTGGDSGGTGGDSGGTGGKGNTEVPGTLLDLPYDGEKASICYAPGECNGDDLLCFGATFTAPGQCAEDCKQDSDCSKIGGLAALCTNGRCLVNCAGDANEGNGPCPTNMECRDLPTENVPGVITPVVVDLLNPNFWCVYPVDGGTNKTALLAQCDLAHGDGDCKGDRACHMPGLAVGAHGYCAARCDDDADCSMPSGVSSMPVCSNDGACEYDCSGPGATCPAGMNCRDIDPGLLETMRCRYID